jgi:hypothetical protein
MLSLDIFKVAKILFSRLVFIFGFGIYVKGDRNILYFTVFCFSVYVYQRCCGSHALYGENMSPSRSHMLSPFCGITKEMMSRGPQVADME